MIRLILTALVFITFVFPKAGFKVSGFPLYASLLSMAIFQVIGLRECLRSIKEALWVASLLSAFLVFLALNANYIGSSSLPLVQIFGYVIALTAMPVFFGARSVELYYRNAEGILRFAFWIIVVYSFLQKVFGDYALVVPGLTANYQDATTPNFLSEKNNMIWGIGYLKATSTYQNGNLYGVNLLLIGFLYISSLRRQFKSFAIALVAMGLSCILTASASVYLGFAAGALHLALSYKGGARAAILLVIATALVGVPLVAVMLSGDSIIFSILQERILNRDLTQGGGRVVKVVGYLDALIEDPLVLFTGMLFYPRVFSEIYEITYLSALQMFGLFVSMSFGLFVAIKSFMLRKTVYFTPIVAYLVAAVSDGASWLPPTMTNFFLVLGICHAWKSVADSRMTHSLKVSARK